MINNSHKTITNWHRIIYIVVLCLFVIGLPQQSDAQGSGKGKTKKKAEWVYLDHADDLKFDQATRPGVQIAKGNVRFRFEDNTLSCDSALLQPDFEYFRCDGACEDAPWHRQCQLVVGACQL